MDAGQVDSFNSSSQIDAYLLDFHPHPSTSRPRRKSRAAYPGITGHSWLRRPCWETSFANDSSSSESEDSDEDDYSWYYKNPDRYVWRPRKNRVNRKVGQRPAKLDLDLSNTEPLASKKYSLPSPTAPSPLLSPGSKLLWRDDFGFPELFEGSQKARLQPMPTSPYTSNPPSSRSSSEGRALSWVNTPTSSMESFDITSEERRTSCDSSTRIRRRGHAAWLESWHSSPFFTSEPSVY
ncbi:hypothetical protein CPB83DRAFT_846425 [Crepidotus variabilis]|uniref:Uncharacterized protein n=1 Tax=Crepidotus variabilis TaxID=179855 RepID=A0A9P6JUF9_9AGAR|nr:hypothetical protein CPB83DRAFT_846425 [Crepidotus variabilis]